MKVESPNEMFEDILLVHQTLLGNQVAFEKLVIKYRHKIFALVKAYVKNSADAEDLTQEVFLKAYQNLSSLNDHRQFSSWLRRIAQNHCTDWLRRQRENHLSFEEIKVAETAKMAPSPEEMALRQEFREIVWQAINSLLEIDRRLIEARYLENTSLKQLQADYGLSYCAIAGRLKRAKQKVREIVQKVLGGFFALPGQEVLEKIFLGGIEAMKLSLKIKLVTVSAVVMLGLGGAGVWLWHSNEAPQKHIMAQQDVKEKKVASAMATSRVQISKPTSKVLKAQPVKSSQSSRKENISGEEQKQFERLLAEPEQSNQQSAENKDSSQSKQDKTTPPALSEEAKAKYQALKEVFVQMKEIQDEMYSTRDELNHWMETAGVPPPNEIPPNADKRAIRMKTLKYLEGEYSILKKMKEVKEEWVATAEQINQIIPGTLVTEEVDIDKPWRHTRYSLNREQIESVLGKMPSEIETSFLPVKGFSFKLTTEEQLENARRLIEQMRELTKK
jgi:RNA polymerase sigma-70 factor (ECF subfamily)